MGKKPLSSSPNAKAFADVHASLAKVEELEKQVAKLSELAYFRNGGRTWKEVATVALHDHEQATAELSALREELDRATKGQWTKAESDAVKWRAQERLGQLGLAYCSWCDYSQQYVVGSDEQAQAHAALRAHAKMCKNNPNHVDAGPASLFMQAVARAEKAEQDLAALDALGRVMFKQVQALQQEIQLLQAMSVTTESMQMERMLAVAEVEKDRNHERARAEAAAAEIAQLKADINRLVQQWREMQVVLRMQAGSPEYSGGKLQTYETCADELEAALTSAPEGTMTTDINDRPLEASEGACLCFWDTARAPSSYPTIVNQACPWHGDAAEKRCGLCGSPPKPTADAPAATPLPPRSEGTTPEAPCSCSKPSEEGTMMLNSACPQHGDGTEFDKQRRAYWAAQLRLEGTTPAPATPVVQPEYTLFGHGTIVVDDDRDLATAVRAAMRLSPVGRVTVQTFESFYRQREADAAHSPGAVPEARPQDRGCESGERQDDNGNTAFAYDKASPRLDRDVMQQIMQVLGPFSACACAGCAWETNEAVRLLREAGIEYHQSRKKTNLAQHDPKLEQLGNEIVSPSPPLCLCGVLTGGARSPHSQCPIHSKDRL
jgi:HAMP domain-containing protein